MKSLVSMLRVLSRSRWIDRGSKGSIRLFSVTMEDETVHPLSIKRKLQSQEKIHELGLSIQAPRFRRLDIDKSKWKQEARSVESIINGAMITREGSVTDGYSSRQAAIDYRFAPGIIDETEKMPPEPPTRRKRKRLGGVKNAPKVTRTQFEAIDGWREEWDIGWDEEDPKWTSSVEEGLLNTRAGRSANPHLLH